MKTSWRTVLLALAAVWAAGCGVEAGNPGDKPKTGTVRLTFSRGQETVASSLKLALDTVELRTDDDSVAAPLALAASSIELVDADGGDVLAASGEEVPVGEYSRVVVALSQDAPLTFRDPGGDERSVGFEGDEDRAFYVEEAVLVEEGQVTELVVGLDARRSFVHPDDAPDRLVFRPHGAMGRNPGFGYVGKVKAPGATLVCAYLYELMPPMGHGERAEGRGGHEPPPPPPPGPGLSPEPMFKTSADVIKDKTAECDHAFGIVPADSVGGWRFDHLLPATYDFRAFLEDGTFEDVETGVVLHPPPPPPPPEGHGDEHGGALSHGGEPRQ